MVNLALLSSLTYLYEIDQSTRMITPKVDRHVKIPKDKITFLECVELQLVFDTSIIFEDKLKVGLRIKLRIALHKMDRYFYERILCLLWDRIGYIPFKWK